MPAATTKSELLSVTETEFAKLQKVMGHVAPNFAHIPDNEDTSIKDVVGHRAHWIDLFLGWYRDGQAGKTVALPAPGYTWSDLKRHNADLQATQKDLGWEDAVAGLSANHQKPTAFTEELDDTALYGAPMQSGKNHWPTGRWAEAAGPSHYRSAAKYIRARLRAFEKS